MRIVFIFALLCTVFCTMGDAWTLNRFPHERASNWVHRATRGWFGADDPFATHSNCTYTTVDDPDTVKWENYTRAQIWDCLLAMGDSNHDGKLTKAEITKGRHDHLNWKEKIAAPYAQTLIDDCSPTHGKHILLRATFMASTNIDCAGTEKNICRVHGVCRREIDNANSDKKKK